MKKLYLLFLLTIIPLLTHADAVRINGIYYNLESNSQTAEVTYNPNGYSGEVVIPLQVIYNEKMYDVTSIGSKAFKNCSGLTSITIPNSVTSIGDGAFYRCSGLTSVTIPNSVTYIGNDAFNGCSGLTSITIPNSVTSIGYNAFEDCSGLTSLTIPNSVTSIGDGAFMYCRGLTSLTIGNSVTSICDYAFSDCSSLTSVTIPNSVTSIGNYAFSGCSGLTSVVIPNSVTSIGSYAFSGCCGLTSVAIPNSVTSIGSSAFSYCSGLTSLTIGNSVTSICDYSFTGCSSLISVVIPNSVTSIGSYAFYDCSGLTSITIPNSVTSIKEYAFHGCSGLTSITIPNSVTSIKEYAFHGCSGLTSLTIGNSVTSICDYSFSGCSSLPSVVIPNSVTSIKRYAFQNCSGLTSFTIGNSVTSIDNYAFSGCSGLTSVVIPNSVTSIGYNAFEDCSGLTSLTIGNSVESFPNNTFWGCSGLTSIKVEEGNIKYDSRDNCNAIIKTSNNQLVLGCQNTVIPNSVTSIGNDAFWGCSGLTSITIPNSVTYIGIMAFYECSGLSSITIPNSVTYIDEMAFNGCTGLISVTVDINTPLAITDGTFSNCANATLYVPEGSKSAYEAADYWKNFKTIQEGAPEEPITSATINVETAGTLSTLISEANRNTITTLTLTGSLNGEDLLFIREMAGSDYHGVPTDGNLTTLDLSGATIVAGGAYFEIQNGEIELSGWNFSGLENGERTSKANTIGEYLFAGCEKLKSITLPNTVTKIEGYAFLCKGLISITMPSSLIEIDQNGFAYCSNLASITIPENVTTIGVRAFQWCTSLTSITIPASVTSLGVCLFQDCTNLASIVVESGNTVYDSRDNCNAIIETSSNTLIFGCKNSTIPSSVIFIERSAFWSAALTSITIPSSVTSIGSGAFQDCTNLASIVVESGNTVYDSRDNCNAIIETSSNKLIVGCKNSTIPSSVSNIGSLAFWRSALTSITIPSSVTTIEDGAFEECAFTSITIPSNVSSIGDHAFDYCYSLTTVTVENSTPVAIYERTFPNRSDIDLIVPVGSISAYKAADYWKEFKTVKDTEGNTEDAGVVTEATINVETPGTLSELISEANKNTITTLTLTGSLNGTDFRFIREMAGSDYHGVPTDGNLTTLDLSGATIVAGGVYVEIQDQKVYCNKEKTSYIQSGGVVDGEKSSEANKIGSYLFAGCQKLQTITLPNNITAIDEFGFWATGLTAIAMPNTVTSIGFDAFYGCSDLASVAIPSSVTSISYPFLGCTNLGSITVDSNNSVYNSLNNCNAIIETNSNTLKFGCKNTTIPSGVTIIGSDALAYHNLTSITIPSSVTTIDNGAFCGCALTSITIPSSVTNIADRAFAENDLQTVTVKNPTPVAIYDETFSNRSNIDLIVPVGSISAYKAADYWKEFKTIKDTEGNTEDAVVVTSATINVATPGTLSELISEANKNTITTLTLTGSLNGVDFRFIREMAGSDYHGVPTDGNLTTLDLSGATIVASGVYVEIQDQKVYYNKEKTSYIQSGGVVDGEKVSEANKIGSYLFAGCQKLQTITLPTNITAIDEFGFWATGLTAITMPNTVTSIGFDAFYGCSDLASVAISSSVTSISYPFLGCTNLGSITVDSNNSVYDSRNNCNAIIETNSNTLKFGCKNTTIPSGVTIIGSDALAYHNLTSITIPSSVTTIDNGAFCGCALTSITIPSSVTNIADRAFAENDLQTVTIENSTPVAIYDETFTNRSNIDLIVPEGCSAAYKAAEYWKDFGTIRPFIPSLFSGTNHWTSIVAQDNYAIPAGLEAYVISSLTETSAVASQIDYIPQGVPILLKRDDATINIFAFATGTGTVSTVNLLKVYDTDKTVANREGYILYKDEFVLVNEGTLPAGRVFLPVNESGSALLARSIVIGGERVTRIDNGIVDAADSKDSWYDIQGQKLSQKPTRKGVYILNGQKVVVKK